jgi:hypothetical protein
MNLAYSLNGCNVDVSVFTGILSGRGASSRRARTLSA